MTESHDERLAKIKADIASAKKNLDEMGFDPTGVENAKFQQAVMFLMANVLTEEQSQAWEIHWNTWLCDQLQKAEVEGRAQLAKLRGKGLIRPAAPGGIVLPNGRRSNRPGG